MATRLLAPARHPEHPIPSGFAALEDSLGRRKGYGPPQPGALILPAPDTYRSRFIDDRGVYDWQGELEFGFELVDRQSSGALAACIVEPILSSGGVLEPPEGYIAALAKTCAARDMQLIFDEAQTGLGRTGTLFACEQARITPDFLCLSKGLTGGFLPLSAVLTTAGVYDAFLAEYTSGKAFLHSHSYTGNALACRAAAATLGMFRDEPVLERNRVLAARLGERLAPFTDHANVAEVRQTGMIAAVELVRDKGTRAPFPAAERRGLRAYLHGLDHGVLLRPLGDVIYFMPPYVISEDEIDFMVDVAAKAIDVAVR